MPDPLKTNIIK